MTQFTPYTALLGGMLIGLSAALLLFFKGRIAGISGIFSGIVVPEKGDISWRVIFILSIVFGALLYQWFGGSVDHISSVTSKPMLIIGGLLVGAGTTLGSGCTSGHGICGIARLSPRSLAATGTFMLTGFITVYLVKHVFGA